MVDYAAWASADILTVEQAAFLWSGIDPSSTAARGAVAPRLQMLQGAIAAGELAADSKMNAGAAIGDFASSFVRRADLMRFAETRGETPAFLFPPSRRHPEPSSSGGVAPDATVAAHLDKLIAADSPLMQKARRNAELIMAENNKIEAALQLAATRAELQRRLPPDQGQSAALMAKALEDADASGAIPAIDIVAFGRRRTTGVKPTKMEATERWLRQRYPNGIPANKKLDVVVAEFAESEGGIAVSVKTLRAAGRRIKPTGNN